MSFADVNGTSLFYEVNGDGYPLVLLHGFGAKKEVWMAQVGALSKDFKVITYDCRSSGKSERPKDPYTIDTLVDDLKGLLDFLKIEKAHLMGQSMGGWVTQNFALKYPEYANKLILVGTNHKGAGIHMMEGSMSRFFELRKENKEQAFWDYCKLTHFRAFIKEMKADPQKKFHGLWSAEDLIKETTEDQMTPHDYKFLADAIDTHDTTDKLSQIPHPTLLIAASNDKLSPKLVMDELNENLPNSRIEFIDKAGHHVFLEYAPQVNKLILDFLNE
jgi:proline-specific peptidase